MNKVYQRLHSYYCLFRFDRPVGTYLLLWPTLWAIWLASSGQPKPKTLMIFVLGVITMRALGSAINDIVDRDIDKFVARTRFRPLTNQDITLFEALLCSAVLIVVALSLVWQLNILARIIAVIGGIFVIVYPFSKRFLPFPQGVLGLTWSFGILMAFAAIQNTLPPVAFLLYVTHVFMTVAYDTIYAICDREDDLKLGIQSTAILFGEHDKQIVALIQFIVIGLFMLVGYISQLNSYYYLFVMIAAMTMVYQQWLIKDYDVNRCLNAFRNNHVTGMVIFIGIVFGFLK